MNAKWSCSVLLSFGREISENRALVNLLIIFIGRDSRYSSYAEIKKGKDTLKSCLSRLIGSDSFFLPKKNEDKNLNSGSIERAKSKWLAQPSRLQYNLSGSSKCVPIPPITFKTNKLCYAYATQSSAVYLPGDWLRWLWLSLLMLTNRTFDESC